MKFLFINKKHISYFAIIIFLLIVSFVCLNLNSSLVETSSYYVSDSFSKTFKNISLENEKIAFLTFDDGPTNTVTPKILDILKEENIKATFFVIGKSAEQYPEIVKRAYEEGHYIANHSYSHNNSHLYSSVESFKEEIHKTELAIQNAIDDEDYCSHLFRFPNGFTSPIYQKQKEKAIVALKEMEYAYIDWNCLTKDAEKKTTCYQLLHNLKQTSKNKNPLIVLMHDTKDVNDSSLVLKDAISYLRNKGFKFENFYSLIYKKMP